MSGEQISQDINQALADQALSDYYANQQREEIYTPAVAPLSVTQPAYFQENSDVAAAYANRANDPNLSSTVNMTPDQFAATHYEKFGAKDQRAAPTGALASISSGVDFANMSGLGSQGVGVNTNSGIAVKDEVADTFKTVFGRDPTPSELDNLRNTYGMSLDPGEFNNLVLSKRDLNVGYGVPTTQSVTPVYGTRTAIDPEYGTEYQQSYITGYTDASGNAVDPSLVKNEEGYEGAPSVYTTPIEALNYSGADGVVGKLTNQIVAQGNLGRFGGEGYGSAEKSAADMALLLAASGITDINQFGVRDKTVTTGDVYGENGDIIQPSTSYKQPEYYNKATGEAINPYYDKASGNTWSGTFAGEGSTSYKVQFQPDGTPIFYSQYGGSSNDLAQMLEDPIIGKIVQAAASYFGGPIGTAALNLAMGKDVDDVAKAALTSWVAGELSAGVSGSSAVVDTLGQTGANIAGRVVGSIATGGGEEGALNALISGGIGAAMPEIQGMIPGYADLPPFGKEFVNSAISSTLRDGKLSEQDLIKAAVQAGKVAYKTATTTTGALPPVVDMGPTSFGTNTTSPLTDAGDSEDGVSLPSGIQTASLDGGLPVRLEGSNTPIIAEDSRAGSVRPPPGYALVSNKDPSSDEPVRFDDNDRILPKSDGSYYDITQNAWFKPTGEFQAVNNVEDFSQYFGNSSLSDSDVANIYQGVKTGDVTAEDLYYLTGKSGNQLSAGEIQRIVSDISRSGGQPTGGLGGEGNGVAGGLPTTDLGEIKIVGSRLPADDLETTEIVDTQLPADDLKETEIDDTRLTDEGCAPGFHDDGTGFCVPDDDKEADGCPEGYVLNLETNTCEPTTTTPTTTTTTTTTPSTSTRPAVVRPASTSQPSLEASITTTPQFLKGAAREKAMKLAALRQLFDSLTPEMQEILMERGITAPAEQNPDEKSEKESPEMAESYSTKSNDASVTTKFAAGGGTISELQGMKDTFNPNLKTIPSMLAAAPIDPKEPPLKLAGLRHLRQAIAKAPRSIDGMAQGGLPSKYAKAAPEGHNPEFITGLTGYYAEGKGTGQSDDIPAMLHDGDYVIDADAVAALGDGSSKAGALALSQFQSKVPHKMSAGGTAVPAKIADGEYVFPEAFVSALGGGDNKQGAKLLDDMREELRAHKRSAPTSKIPPKAKSPLDYLRMAKG